MARPREFDEQQALLKAMHLFWQKGYEATSISDLTAAMGIQRPSLYGTFGDKEELFHAALRKYADLSLVYIGSKLRAAPSAREAVRLYLLGITNNEDGKHPEWGCLCVNTLTEMAARNASLAQFTSEFQWRLSELLRETIQEGISSGELSDELNAASVASALTISAVGISVMMKAQPDRNVVEGAIEQLVHLLK
ncbi:TetR/AcrR family transcriptional regulator [Paenibacillus sinopodophylli]|uniref:TetR/AcrR family transcriptional regulator n=1 Tax=Paenibacillus sinopodophylli TaxID=1837342 RepID=UPI00110CCD2D|nr:TetR/AcrR family transcriptional regulator [Paenibacillus sinopodophylli]